jgi:hypothetical protein
MQGLIYSNDIIAVGAFGTAESAAWLPACMLHIIMIGYMMHAMAVATFK